MKSFNYLNIQDHPTFIVFVFALLAMLVILPSRAMAVDFVVANQMTLTWEATAPVNAGEGIEYAIYIAPDGDKPSATKLPVAIQKQEKPPTGFGHLEFQAQMES